jgi:hypothetical protein
MWICHWGGRIPLKKKFYLLEGRLPTGERLHSRKQAISVRQTSRRRQYSHGGQAIPCPGRQTISLEDRLPPGR